MLKQSPSRNQRSKGFKVKHVLQMLLLLAICIWLIFQMKRSHDKKKAYDEESSSDLVGKMQSGGEFIRLGRRDLRPLVKGGSFRVEKQEGKEEEEVEEEMGGGDDEIDVRDRERAEEEESEGAEDLIDEDDRERDEGSEEDKGIDLEDMNLMEDEDEIEEGKSELQETKEELYKDEDEVDEVDMVRHMRGISQSLRKVQVEKFESVDNEVEKETQTYSENATSTDLMLLLVKDSTLNGTKPNLASNGGDSYLQTTRTYSDSTLPTIDDSDTDGSLSIVSHRNLQLDATAWAEKSASKAITIAVSSGEPKTNGGLYSGEESSMISTAVGKSGSVDADENEEEEIEEEKSIESLELLLSEEDEE